MIKATCICGEAFEVPDSMAGKADTCPACGLDVIVPASRGEDSPAAAAEAMQALQDAAARPEPVKGPHVPQQAAPPHRLHVSTALNVARLKKYPGQGVAGACDLIGALLLITGAICLLIGVLTLDHGGWAVIVIGCGEIAASLIWFAIGAILVNVGHSRLATERQLMLYEASLKDGGQ